MEQVQLAKQSCSDPLILVEQRLDFTRWVARSFGTSDCIIVADGTLTVIDFKYGVGILVEADNNSQMRMYALGALNLFESLYDIQKIRMAIFQPRRDNVSIAELTKDELLHWADETLIPAATLASKGEGIVSSVRLKQPVAKGQNTIFRWHSMNSQFRIHLTMKK